MKTKSTSEIQPKLTNKLILIVITALLLSMSAGFGATTKWTGADQVTVSGVASLAGKLSVTMTGTTFTAGSTYTLLHAAGGFDPNHPQFQAVSIKGGSGACFTPIIT